jgi:hypothetical protein
MSMTFARDGLQTAKAPDVHDFRGRHGLLAHDNLMMPPRLEG